MGIFAQKESQSSGRSTSNARKPDATDHPHALEHLQQTIGNRAVQGLLQTHAVDFGARSLQSKLLVNTPGDVYEREADRVSEQVIRMPGPGRAAPPRSETSIPLLAVRDAPGNRSFGAFLLPTAQAGSGLQRLSRSGMNGAPEVAPPLVDEVLGEPGQPLELSTRALMEPTFGSGVADVRVHTGPKSAESARAVSADAYTVGRQIVFDTGRYAPGTAAGRRLLAHELTHVAQQSRSRAGVGLGLQRQESQVLSAVGSTALGLLRGPGPIGIGGTQSRIIAAALSGMVLQVITELSGSQGALFLSNLSSFSRKDAPKFLGGYYLGVIEGVLSPITDLFGMAVFGEHMRVMAENLLTTAMVRRSELADDLRDLFLSLAEVREAIAPLLAHIRAQPGRALLDLLSLPSHLAAKSEELAFELGKKGGSQIVHALNEPWGSQLETPAPQEPFWKTPLAAIQHGAESLKGKLIETPWARIGNKVGYAVGFAVITVVMFAFTDGLGNLITGLGNILGKVSKSLGVLGRGLTTVAEAMKSIGIAINAVEKLIALGIGKLLKPIEHILEPVIKPLNRFLESLKTFLRKLFGVAEKEAAPALTSATTKGAGVLVEDITKSTRAPPIRTAHAGKAGVVFHETRMPPVETVRRPVVVGTKGARATSTGKFASGKREPFADLETGMPPTEAEAVYGPLSELEGPQRLPAVLNLESIDVAKQAGVPDLLMADGTVMTRADLPDILPDVRPGGRPAPRPLAGAEELVARGRPVSLSEIQNVEVRADARLLLEAGDNPASLRVNQAQVIEDVMVGTNRPDIYAELHGRRIHIEYDRSPPTRALEHARRILSNDPDAIVILKVIDF